MRLILVRHADAGDREDFAKTGKPDEQRPLSGKGKKQMASAAAGLKKLVDACDMIATSPLTRAQQTAAIVAREFQGAREATIDALDPDATPDRFLAWLGEQSGVDTVMAVGHEPHLGALATWLMTGYGDSRIEFRKGGACLLDFEGGGTPKKGAATLQWLMGPKQLGAL
jgi:phosphohistidine phosphatase